MSRRCLGDVSEWAQVVSEMSRRCLGDVSRGPLGGSALFRPILRRFRRNVLNFCVLDDFFRFRASSTVCQCSARFFRISSDFDGFVVFRMFFVGFEQFRWIGRVLRDFPGFPVLLVLFWRCVLAFLGSSDRCCFAVMGTLGPSSRRRLVFPALHWLSAVEEPTLRTLGTLAKPLGSRAADASWVRDSGGFFSAPRVALPAFGTLGVPLRRRAAEASRVWHSGVSLLWSGRRLVRLALRRSFDTVERPTPRAFGTPAFVLDRRAADASCVWHSGVASPGHFFSSTCFRALSGRLVCLALRSLFAT